MYEKSTLKSTTISNMSNVNGVKVPKNVIPICTLKSFFIVLE